MLKSVTRLIPRLLGAPRPIALMYHSVSPGRLTPAWPWAVSMRAFRDQLDLLQDGGWRSVTVSELALSAGAYSTDRLVAITFDDGFLDNLPAFEEITRRGMKATLYVVSGSVGSPPGWPATSEPRPTTRLLNDEELRALQRAGIEIGSHSVNHPRLTQVRNDSLQQELAVSKESLEGILGAQVSTFAYPFGDWDARCAAAVQEAGYRSACTTQSGWALHDGDPFAIRRLTISNTDSLSAFALKISLGSNDTRWSRAAGYAWKNLVH